MCAQCVHVAKFSCRNVGTAKFHMRSFSGFERFLPSWCTQTPLVACLKSCESKLWHRRGEIVARGLREFEEFIGHDCAHGVHTRVIAADFTTSGAVETRHGGRATGLQEFAQYIDLVCLCEAVHVCHAIRRV